MLVFITLPQHHRALPWKMEVSNSSKYLVTLLPVRLYNDICLCLCTAYEMDNPFIEGSLRGHTVFKNPHFPSMERKVKWTTIDALDLNVSWKMPSRA